MKEAPAVKLPEWYEELLKQAGLLHPSDLCETIAQHFCGLIRKMADLTAETGREHGVGLCVDRKTSTLQATAVVSGTEHDVDVAAAQCPEGSVTVGFLHTHHYAPGPSTPDIYVWGWPSLGCAIAAKGDARYIGGCWTNVPEEAKELAFELAELDKRYKKVANRISELKLCAEEDPECREEYRKAVSEADTLFWEVQALLSKFVNKYGCRLDCRKPEKGREQ